MQNEKKGTSSPYYESHIGTIENENLPLPTIESIEEKVNQEVRKCFRKI